MEIRCWPELVKYGVEDIMRREYGQWLAPSAQPTFSVTLQFDVAQVPSDPGPRVFARAV